MTIKPEVVAKIIELGKAGKTLEEIAGECGVSPGCAGEKLRAAGISNNRYRQHPKGWRQSSSVTRDAAICKLWAEGLSAPQICERLGIRGVSNILTQLGLTSRSAPRVTYNSSVSGGSGAANMGANFARRT